MAEDWRVIEFDDDWWAVVAVNGDVIASFSTREEAEAFLLGEI